MELRINNDHTEKEIKNAILLNFQEIVGKNVDFNKDLVFIIQNFVKMVMGSEYEAINPQTKEIEKMESVRGFYVAGGIGSGKTTLIKVLLKTLKDLRIYYNFDFESTNFFFTDKVFSQKDLQKLYSSGNELPVNYSTICLDDLPNNNVTYKYMGNESSLDLFIQDRYDNKKLTFITSNYPLSDKYLNLDIRTISRLFEMCAYYELKHEDFRKLKK